MRQAKPFGGVLGLRRTGAVTAVCAALALALAAPAWASASAAGSRSATALGRSELISVKSLPGTWTQSPYGSSGGGGGDGGANSPGGAACNLKEPGVDQDPPTVESPYFDQANTSVEFQEEIDVYPSAAQARRDVAFSGTRAVQRCMVAAFNQERTSLAQSIGKGATVGTITTSQVPVRRYDQGTTDLRLIIPITYQGVRIDLYVDTVTMAQGRSEAVLDESDLGSPVPARLRSTFESAVAKKL